MRFAFSIALVVVSMYFGVAGTNGEMDSPNLAFRSTPGSYVASIAMPTRLSMGQSADIHTPQSIVPGSVGSTRDAALPAWGIDELAEPVFTTTNGRGQMIIYDTEDMKYQITFIFEVQNDEKPRLTDRAIVVNVSLVNYETVDRGVAMLGTLLPQDAEPVGNPMENNIGDRVMAFESAAVAEVLPQIEDNGDAKAGMIWLTVGMIGDKVGAIEISALDPGDLSPIED